LFWLFAAACLSLLLASAPHEARHAGELRAGAASIAPVPARDAGKALLRDAHSVRIAAPAPEPLPPLLAPRALLRVERPARQVIDGVRAGPRGVVARVVRWRHHVPRMDSGEPPRSEAFAS
jgi:hypothetical protein